MRRERINIAEKEEMETTKTWETKRKIKDQEKDIKKRKKRYEGGEEEKGMRTDMAE